MLAFRVFMVAFWLVLAIYTLVVTAEHGLTLIPIFFGDIAALTWPGQFNLDFFGFLMLSALWVAWRNQFSATGLLLAPAALFGGIAFLMPYLLYLTFAANGDMREVLLGKTRAAG